MIDDNILLAKTPGGRPVFIGGLCRDMLNLKFISKPVAILARQQREESEVSSASWRTICFFLNWSTKLLFEVTGVDEVSKQRN